MPKKILLILLAVLMSGVALRLYNLQYFHSMTADESVYTQAAFAMTKGYLSYSDVFIAHPLLHFIIEYPFVSIDSSLLIARLPSILLSFGTMLLVFYTARDIYSERVAVLATILFAFSPYTLHFNKLAIVENTLSFFSMILFYYFFKHHRRSNRNHLLLSGFFAGVAFITKYTILFVLIVLVCYFLVKKEFKSLGLFTVFASIIPLTFLSLLLLFGLYSDWYIQTVSFQFIRFRFPLSFNFSWFREYVMWSLPLFIVAVPTMIYRKTEEDTLLTFLYIIPFFLMASGKVFLPHYPLMLTPILCILGACSLDKLLGKGGRKKKLVVFLIPVLVLHLYIFGSSFLGSDECSFQVRAKIEVSEYIRDITRENDQIWTTDADIAFLAGRLIVSPSEIWRYQGFYEDVWGYMGTTYIGQYSGYQGGLITLDEIRQVLEKEKPIIVVIVKQKFTDQLIWNGIDNSDYSEMGLAEYVLTHYDLDRNLYDVRIYVRKN